MSTEIINQSLVSATHVVQNKMPVTSLQEFCIKRGLTPVYELLDNENSGHQPSFTYKVTAGSFTAEGKGSSKKNAKHNAAAQLLPLLLLPKTDDGQSLNGGSCECLLSIQDDLENQSPVNYIGELQELSQRHLWPLPVYKCIDENGLPHERDFTCNVHLFNLSATGVGRSKKLAKRNAAENLLKLIKNNSDVESLSSLHSSNISDTENCQINDYINNLLVSLKSGNKIQTLSQKDRVEISLFYQGLKYRTGKTLASLQVLALNMPATNYCQMVQEIAEEQNFEATYVDIPHLTSTGEFQCLVELSTMPIAVCQGIGRTKDEAHAMAAHAALQYLKIMTRK